MFLRTRVLVVMRLLSMIGLALILVAGCSRTPTSRSATAPAAKNTDPSLECVLFHQMVQGRGGHSSQHQLRRHDADHTESITRCLIEHPLAGPKEDTALRIDVSFTESRDGADVYTVNYHLTTGGQKSSRKFKVRYAGEPVTALDDEYGQLVFRPPTH